MRTLEYYLSLPYRLEVIPDIDEGGYGARFPELPGCITCAKTWDAVLINAEDAKKSWLTAAIEDGVDIPEPEIYDTKILNVKPHIRKRVALSA